MLTYNLDDGKIFAAWDEDKLNSWIPKDAYDASPAGLSGKKEGFYFANWLMPFTIPFDVTGVKISPNDYPGCLEVDPFPCDSCRFFNKEICPIYLDKENIKLTRSGFKFYKKLVFCVKGGYDGIFDAARKELLLHGKPLHYQVLSKILASRYYSLHVTDRKLFKTLRLNPTFFLNIDDGVYQAVSGVEKCTESPNFLYIEYLIMDDSEDQ